MPFRKNNLSRRQTLGILASAGAASMLSAGTISSANAIETIDLPAITKGVNIPLWMDQPDGSSRPPSDAVLSLLKQFGFNTIRLPIDPDRFAFGGVESLNASRDLSAILDKLEGFGLSVTLDMHPQGQIARALRADKSGDTPLINAWAKIADVARGYSAKTTYLELLNEPQMWRDRWLPLRDQLAETVRTICPEHTIIWGANKYQTIDETISCAPLDDVNSIVAVHYYTPMLFTHQCKTWGVQDSSAPRDLPFPANQQSPKIVAAMANMDQASADQFSQSIAKGWDISQIHNDFERLGNWAKSNDTKIILNEFGSLKFCTDPDSRANWTRAVREAAEQNNIGWTYWEFDRGFGFMGDRTSLGDIDIQLVAALVGGNS